MRSSNALRFYGFTAAVFLIVVLVGLTFRRSLPQPEEILEHLPQFTKPQFTKPHVDSPSHSSAAAPPSSGSTSHSHGSGKSPHVGSTYLDYKPNPQPPLAKDEDYDLHQVNLRKLVWWDPSQYDDEILPELDEWPGPAPDGKYGDITDLMNDTMRKASAENQRMKHFTLKSKLTSTGKFLKIDWLGDHEGYNPNIIPHPHKEGTWVVIAQKDKSRDDDTLFSQELYCEATIVKDTLKCTKSPLQLPIASTVSPHCAKDMEWFDSNVGPHDARLFHGKDRPYIMYNQQSEFNCVGMWINDARRLVDYGGDVPTDTKGRFFWPTNLQKAGGNYSWIEKNWFPFWASNGDMYLHYDFTPTRLYAKLNEDGSVGKDLSYMSHEHDQACMARYMPKLKDTGLEWFHQASNALEITMCKSTDPDCKATDDNTYVFVIFQTKTFYNHGQYEPYIMMFKRTAPFQIHGISKTPFWYHGRGTAFGKWRLELTKPRDQSQMIFTTSISWQSSKRKYNGFLDDELMICFGIEDKHSGVMDVTIGDLIADIAFC